MKIIRKDATIENVGADEEFPGSFEVVLSTPAKDRDGDELSIEDWKQPLPEHITFDMDHGMSVEKTIGSGVPSIEDGRLIVRGSYSSLPRAQEVRTLVSEGHIRTTSVAFASEKVTKDGKTRTQRELLNGAFVAIPSNTEAVVLSAKAGARHNAADQAHVQAIYDHAVALGGGPMDDTGADEDATGGKAAVEARTKAFREALTAGMLPLDVVRAKFGLKAKYDAETLRQMLSDGHAIENSSGDPSYPIGDKDDLEKAIHAVGRGGGDHDKIRAYIIRRAKALGASDRVPDDWNSDGSVKAASAAETTAIDPDSLISINMSASAGGFDVSINAWCVPGAESDAYADTAQRVLAAALESASGGPVDDDNDEGSIDSAPAAPTKAAPAADATEKTSRELQALALKVLAGAYAD